VQILARKHFQIFSILKDINRPKSPSALSKLRKILEEGNRREGMYSDLIAGVERSHRFAHYKLRLYNLLRDLFSSSFGLNLLY